MSKDHLILYNSPHNVVYVKKYYTSFFHLFYRDNDYFDQYFIRNLRDNQVMFWDGYQKWESPASFDNLVDRNWHLENDTASDLFQHLQDSSFTSFFSTNLIDIPKCFKTVKSLYRPSHTLPIFKFINLIIRTGYKEKVLKILSTTMGQFMLEAYRRDLGNALQFETWSNLYLSFSTTQLQSTTQKVGVNQMASFFLWGLHETENQYRFDKDKYSFFELFFRQIPEITPTFNFYVYKVNKSKRKNSRGKTGKYTLLWKYIAPFKRLYLTFRWLLKDLKTQKARSLENRMSKFLSLLHFNLHQTLAARAKVFSHRVVFQNYRRTLMSTLRARL